MALVDKQFGQTVILRNNQGMIRDAFWQQDPQDQSWWLVIRQIRDGGNNELTHKEFRLHWEEALTLAMVIEKFEKGEMV